MLPVNNCQFYVSIGQCQGHLLMILNAYNPVIFIWSS